MYERLIYVFTNWVSYLFPNFSGALNTLASLKSQQTSDNSLSITAPSLLSPPCRAKFSTANLQISFNHLWAGLGSSLYSFGADPAENTTFNSSFIIVGVFTYPLPRCGRLFIRLLRSNGCGRCLFRGLCLATGLYATELYFMISCS
jgi:hypothetical protein